MNFFQPSMKLIGKKRIGTHIKKTYDTAKTPYQRLLVSGILNEEQKKTLQIVYDSLNPVDMKQKINRLTEKLNKTLRYKICDSTNT